MVAQIGPLVQVGRRKTALAIHVLGGITGGAVIGVLLGLGGLLLRAALGDTLDTVFLVVVPAALAYAACVDARPAAPPADHLRARRPRAPGRARSATIPASSPGASTSGSA